MLGLDLGSAFRFQADSPDLSTSSTVFLQHFLLLLGSSIFSFLPKPCEPWRVCVVCKSPINKGVPFCSPSQTSTTIVPAQKKGNCLFPGVSLLRCQPAGLQYGMTKVFFTGGCDPCTENKQNNTRQRGWSTAVAVSPACSDQSLCQYKGRGHIEKAAASHRQQLAGPEGDRR